jgi:DNA polymerase-3 subunit epsilon
MLQLDRPLVFFDLETTGLSVASDRIVEISFLKVYPEFLDTHRWTERLNPTIPISESARQVHGISDEDIADKPTFKKMARQFFDYLQDCDLAGYNCLRFDVPMLAEEFLRCRIPYPTPETRIVDVGVIFKKYEKRTLAAALQFYCQKELTNAHTAEADTLATFEVLLAQLQRYTDLGRAVNELDHLSSFDVQTVDWAGKICLDEDGDACYNFSSKKGTKIKDQPGLAEWMLRQDFTLDTKQHVRRILREAN